MSDRDIRVSDGEFTVVFPSGGTHCAELYCGKEPVAAIGRCSCGKFGENLALEQYLRLHPALSADSAVVEGSGVIPFGCEYQIRREMQLCSGAWRGITDLAALNGGKIAELELESWEVFGAWQELEYFLGDGKSVKLSADAAAAEKTYYSDREPIILLRVLTASGIEVEFACGSDLWRHRAASHLPGCDAEYVLASANGQLRYVRRALRCLDGTEPEKRPWRYKSLWSYRRAGLGETAAANVEIPLSGCALSDASRRQLRRAVRRASGNVVFTGAAPAICTDGAHVDRPGKDGFEHWDLEEYLVSYLWSNRQLSRHGGSAVFAPFSGPFSGSVLGKVLSQAPKPLTFNQPVEE